MESASTSHAKVSISESFRLYSIYFISWIFSGSICSCVCLFICQWMTTLLVKVYLFVEFHQRPISSLSVIFFFQLVWSIFTCSLFSLTTWNPTSIYVVYSVFMHCVCIQYPGFSLRADRRRNPQTLISWSRWMSSLLNGMWLVWFRSFAHYLLHLSLNRNPQLFIRTRHLPMERRRRVGCREDARARGRWGPGIHSFFTGREEVGYLG